MARQRQKNPSYGYARDFINVIDRIVPELQNQSSLKIVTNAGGLNPPSCAAALGELLTRYGMGSIPIGVVTGDDLLNDLDRLEAMNTSEMFSGDVFPPKEKIASANAYIGAFPIAAALAGGADIVVTGRCVDSAVTLGACIHEFGWSAGDLDKLAAGSAVGHLIECGPQATGGNFTDWEQVADSLHEVGYPIAEVWEDGTADIYKPADTGGLVNRGTVAEQLLYEIGDPAAYMLPDVICDFTQIQLEEVATDRVRVTHARGRGVPETYKTSMTWADGWRAGSTFWYVGRRAADKARIFADEAVTRTRRKCR